MGDAPQHLLHAAATIEKPLKSARLLAKKGTRPSDEQQLAAGYLAAVAIHQLKLRRRNTVIGDEVGKVRRWIGSEALSNPLLVRTAVVACTHEVT
jgi:hypothetical protein